MDCGKLTLFFDVNRDTYYMFGLHERPLTYDISSPGTKRSKYKKGKDLTNQTVKPRWA